MPSEHRLHPASLIFALWGSVKTFAIPAVFFVVSSLGGSSDGRGLETWQIWAMVFAALAIVNAVIHYVTFRLTYEGRELIIRSGFFVRNERHVPYDRIQNLDATRRILHRLLHVAEVRVETGGGTEPEARISVLHEDAFAEMRRRVFEGRAAAAPAGVTADTGEASVPPAAAPLLYLPPRELALLGVLENRGLLALAAVYGVLWELGWQDALWNRITGNTYAVGALSDVWTRLSAGRLPALGEVGIMAAGLLILLALVRLLSMIWVNVTLHGFRLTRVGDDLRTEYGLLTRVTATVPRRRIQALTVHATPLQRWAGRASVRVETAGGRVERGDGSMQFRERLAPIVRAPAVADLVRSIMPVCDLDRLEWQPVDARAFRRAVKPMLLLCGVPSLLLLALVNWRLWPLTLVVMLAGVLVTRKQVQHFAWALTGDTFAARSGWLWTRLTVAPLARVQTVSTTESPFDRRAGMAAVWVDTAGSPFVSRLRIPYLARDVARDLSARLSTAAAETAFRW